MTRKPLLLVAALLLGIFLWRAAFPPKELIPWRHDFAAAQQEAEQSNKPVFAYFTAAWCGPCQQMKRTTWADANVEQALRRYVPVKIDIDQNPALALRYGADAIPHLVILNPDGSSRWTHSGYLSVTEFLTWLNEAAR
jgi:thiol:disulfide interchange protein